MTKQERPPQGDGAQEERARQLSEERKRLVKALLGESAAEGGPEGPAGAGGPGWPSSWGPGMPPPPGNPAPDMGAGPPGAGPAFPFGGGPFGGGPFGGFPGGMPPEWSGLFNAFAAASSGPASETSPLVPLKPSGSREPFFLVHAVLGAVFRYHHLALHLPKDRPVYGLQARGLDGRCEPHTRIEDMASEYVAAIRGVQPRGPYYLGGYSMGGLIAFEMAQQLLQAGERVALLALLGTNAPSSGVRSFDFWLGYLESAQRLFGNTFKMYQASFSQGPEKAPWSLPPPVRVAMACTRAAMSYAPRSHPIYPGRLDVFATAEQLVMCRADMTLGWRAFCAGGIELHPVEGNHLSMIEEPSVGDTARKLTTCLHREESPGHRT